jgi:putative transposase
VKVEKLPIRNMSASAKGTLAQPCRNVAVKSGLNRSILDQGWSMVADMVGYKLAERGGGLQSRRRLRISVCALSMPGPCLSAM